MVNKRIHFPNEVFSKVFFLCKDHNNYSLVRQRFLDVSNIYIRANREQP